MRDKRPTPGVPSLSSITARASSARVLDLHTLAIECANDPDHRARPLFGHPVLNRTILVKHHPRPGEFEMSDARAPIVTKVIFPFDLDDLDLGGQFLLADQPDVVDQLARRLDYRDCEGDAATDLATLKLLDSLPTLDPFLLKEALIAHQRDVAPCYFRLSPADRSEMLEFVAQQVETLIDICFAGMDHRGPGEAKRLSALLLAEGDSPELDPLREAMRMDRERFARAVFCWKAVLYYRWRSRLLSPELRATRRALAKVDAARFDDDAARFVRAAVAELESLTGECERKIAELFNIYDGVFEALKAQRSPEPFRRFLVDGPKVFAKLGERMGRLEQLISYWQHQFPDGPGAGLSPENIFDGLRSLVSALSPKGGRLTGERGKGQIWYVDVPSDHDPKSRRPEFRAAG